MKSELKEEIKERIMGCCSLIYGFGRCIQAKNAKEEEKRTIKDLCKMIERNERNEAMHKV